MAVVVPGSVRHGLRLYDHADSRPGGLGNVILGNELRMVGVAGVAAEAVAAAVDILEVALHHLGIPETEELAGSAGQHSVEADAEVAFGVAGPPVWLHGLVKGLVSAEEIVDVGDLAIPVAESFPDVDGAVPVDGAVSASPAADAAKVGVAGIIFEIFVKQDFRHIVIESVIEITAGVPARVVIIGVAFREI